MKKIMSVILSVIIMVSALGAALVFAAAEYQYSPDETTYYRGTCGNESMTEGESYAVKVSTQEELNEKWGRQIKNYDESVFDESFFLFVNWVEPCDGRFHDVTDVRADDSGIEIELSEIPEEKGVAYATVITPYCAAIKMPKDLADKEIKITVNKITYISTAAELKNFADSVNAGDTYEGKTVMLTRDIDLSEICGADINGAEVSWTPIGTKENRFNGNFDGDGHSINNAYITHTDVGSGLYRDGPYYIGLFGYAQSSSVIKNLNIDGSIKINGDLLMTRPPSRALHYIGAVAGYSGGNIQNCHSTASIDISGNTNYYGGIVGWLEGKTERCSNSGMLAVDDKGFGGIVVAGGICGIIGKGASIYDCFNTGDVDGFYAGGIIGSSTNDSIGIFNCYNVANISGNDENATGQIGDYTTASIKNCYYLGDEQFDGWVRGMTAEQFASGEVAYLLGEAWGQKIGTDEYPVLDGDKVYLVNDKYTNTPLSEEDIQTAFTDANFLSAIRALIGKSDDEPICKSDVEDIEVLDVANKGIKSFDGIEYFTGLKELLCYANEMEVLDLSDNTALEMIDCSYNMRLTSLNVSKNTALEGLYCNYTNLSELNVQNNVRLKELVCFYNGFKTIDLSKNEELTYLDIRMVGLTSLDISHNPKLQYVNCTHNYMYTTDDVAGYEDSGLILGDTFRFTPQKTEAVTDKFTDDVFLKAVRDTIHKPDGDIYPSDLEKVTELKLDNMGLVSLDGIEYFISLKSLSCVNNNLKTIDISNNINLKELYCWNNYLGDDPKASIIGLEIVDLGEAGEENSEDSFRYFPQRIYESGTPTQETSILKINYENNKLTITALDGREQKADVYAVSYDTNGVLKTIDKLTDAVPAEGYENEINLETGSKIFTWNGMMPLAAVFELKEE